MNDYICEYCNKIYKSNNSRINHYNLKHLDEYNEYKNNKKETKFNCDKCNKILSDRHSKYRHEKICNNIENLTNEVSELKKSLNLLLNNCKIHPKTLQKINKQLINNGTTNNTTNTNNGIINNNIINIIKFGDENLENILSEKEMINILKQKKLSLEESIKIVHFNDNRPEYKNIYITNLKNEFAYKFNGEKFISVYKDELITELIDNHFNYIEDTIDNYKNKISEKDFKVLQQFIDMMNDDETKFTHHELNKTYQNYKKYKIDSIKLLVFNNTDKNIIKVVYN
jgi:hypothetical protein